ncbi:hypothetical protein SESBI_45058 [Sesbania bispinosa]|nr:hypothetical protein SESBI_45058 [Sesbania bispinosa]
MANYQYPNAAGIPAAPAGETSTPRPGGQRRRKNNRQGGRGQQPPARLPPPTGAPPCPGKNDPLWTPGMAGTEMTAMPSVEYIFSSCEALPEVISVMHSSLCCKSAGYNRRVPESAFAYYCATVTYARLLKLHHDNGCLTSWEEEYFIKCVAALDLKIPVLLAHYLAGFGNTHVPCGRDIKFRMLDRPDYVGGWFGRVSPATQPLYQNYPCLAVFLSRMFAALKGAENDPIWWDFPEEIQPDLPYGIRPSTACIGYGPRERLSIDQRTFLEFSILGETFPSDNSALPLCQSVLFSVGNELAAAGIKLSPCPTALVGSQAQLGLITISQELVPINNKTMSFKCPYQMPSEISFSASAFMYRVHHAVDDLRPGLKINIPWCVWHYESKHCDDCWSDFGFQGNQLSFGEPQFLQILEFQTTPFLVRARLQAMERAFHES